MSEFGSVRCIYWSAFRAVECGSEYQMSRAQDIPQRAEAVVRKNSWPGWIWAIPIAAAVIVIWLAVRALSTGGKTITISFDDADGLSSQSAVMYRGVQVGKVTRVMLAKGLHGTVADVHIDDDVKQELTSGTRFYLQNAQPSLSDLSSLKSMLSGATIIMVPGKGHPTDHFAGKTGTPPERLEQPVSYRMIFSQPVGELKQGAKVTFDGFDVGDVQFVRLNSDFSDGSVTISVLVSLDAARFHLVNLEGKRPSAVLSDFLNTLVDRGLRARVVQTPPVIGSSEIALTFIPGAPPAALSTGDRLPEIPTSSGGGISALMTKLGELPITQIGENVRAITQILRGLVSSPQLRQSITNLNLALARLNKVIGQAAPQVEPTIEDLRNTAQQIDETARQARQTLGGNIGTPEGNLQQSLRELTEAARAIRSLADYIDRHPEALIKGR